MHKYLYFPAPNTHCALVVALSKKASTIKYGYRKCGTHAQVLPQTLAHGNSKNEIRQRNRRWKEERGEYGKKYNGHEKQKKSRRPITS